MWAVLCATEGRLHPGPHPPGPCGIQTHPASGPVASVFMPATPWEFLPCTLGGSTHHERNFWQLCADKGGGGQRILFCRFCICDFAYSLNLTIPLPEPVLLVLLGTLRLSHRGGKLELPTHTHTGLGFRDAVLCRLVSAPP